VLPAPVALLADALAGLPGVVAVALGGSRAAGGGRPDSDWDLGLYYRGAFDPDSVRGLGHRGVVSAVGEWGPFMNGGAWLAIDEVPVDVLFRDLDTVERWVADAQAGRFEVLMQNGYLAGAPTYLAAGELALDRVLHGALPRPAFPAALATAAPARWRGRAGVALLFADGHAGLGDGAACSGLLAQAVLCEAHARLAERRAWALNEKGLVERAGLGAVAAPVAGGDVAAVAAALGIEPLRVR
jgi:predicted nucleotidyltransferase